jgi:hypothetical protein
MVGVAVFPISGTADLSRVEAPVTLKAYLLCAFAAFGGICQFAPAPTSPSPQLSSIPVLFRTDLASLWL